MEKGKAHAERRQGGGGDVVHWNSEKHRIAVAALGRHHAAHCLEHRIEARFGCERPLLTKTIYGHGHDAGIDLGEGGVVDLEPLADAKARVVDDRVGAAHQRIKGLASRRRAQVDGQATLAAVEDEAWFAEGVARRRFHLDDVGAELGEQHPRVRSGHDRPEIQDPEAGQRAAR